MVRPAHNNRIMEKTDRSKVDMVDMVNMVGMVHMV